MKAYRSGEIVLLSFPFADTTGAKRRPGWSSWIQETKTSSLLE